MAQETIFQAKAVGPLRITRLGQACMATFSILHWYAHYHLPSWHRDGVQVKWSCGHMPPLPGSKSVRNLGTITGGRFPLSLTTVLQTYLQLVDDCAPSGWSLVRGPSMLPPAVP